MKKIASLLGILGLSFLASCGSSESMTKVRSPNLMTSLFHLPSNSNVDLAVIESLVGSYQKDSFESYMISVQSMSNSNQESLPSLPVMVAALVSRGADVARAVYNQLPGETLTGIPALVFTQYYNL